MIYVGYSDLESEVTMEGASNCSGMLQVSLWGRRRNKDLAPYSVTPFDVELNGHERNLVEPERP